MKKLLSLFLALLLVSALIPAAQASERVVIQLTRPTFNLLASDLSQVKKVEKAINDYIADKINVEIRLRDVGSDNYPMKVRPALDAGEINLLWTASWETGISTDQLVAEKLVYDITDLLPGSPLYASMSVDQWEITRYQDRNYYIPVYKDNVEGYDVMFRKDLVDAHGWDIYSVDSLEDLEPMLAEAKADGIRFPFLTQKTPMFFRWFLDRFDFITGNPASNFIAVDRETNQVVNTLQTPEYVGFAKLMGSWVEKGYLSLDDVNRLTSDTTMKTKSWAISWWTDVPVNREASQRYGQEVVMRNLTDRYAHSNSSLGSCYCITASSTPRQARAAIDFLGLLFTDRTLADMYTFGIEGEDFDYTQTESQSIRHVTQHSSKYNHSMWECSSAMVVTPLANEPDIKDNLYIDFNGGAEISVAAGFRPDITPVEEAYRACLKLFDQYGFILENGGIPAGEVDARLAEYQAALDEAGYQQILSEFTRQYDAWKAQQ